jgi:hypothetical protein
LVVLTALQQNAFLPPWRSGKGIHMFRKLLGALAISAASVVCAPANANVVYNLTFKDFGSTVEGTGTLTLNFATLAQDFNQNTTLNSILVAITTTDLHGHGVFSITPANLASGSQFQTGNVGQIFTLTAEQSGSGASSVLFLDLFTNSWQLHNGNDNGPTADQGAFTITGPTLQQGGNDNGATPLPAALPLFASGAGVLGFLGWRRKRKQAA